MTAALIAAALLGGLSIGLLFRHRQSRALAENVEWTGEDLATRKATDVTRDLVENRRLRTPEPPQFMRLGRDRWGVPT